MEVITEVLIDDTSVDIPGEGLRQKGTHKVQHLLVNFVFPVYMSII